jgi:hypothetical protein
MPNEPGVVDAHLRAELTAEIVALEENYAIIRKYLSGTEYDSLEIISTLQMFKTGLDKISAQILTLYELRHQRTKITWEPLLGNLGNALDTLKGRRSATPRPAIQAALDMSEPNVQEVMNFLSKLKASLQ